MNIAFTPGMVERDGRQILTTHFGYLAALKAALDRANIAYVVGAGPGMVVVEFCHDDGADLAWPIAQIIRDRMA